MTLEVWRQRARRLKRETYALVLAARHPQVPWHTKALVLAVVGYALSPLDLIPDFVPIIGFLDDFILIPLGIALVLRLMPPGVLEECRVQAQQEMERGRLSRSIPARIATVIIVLAWLLGLALTIMLLVRVFGR
jgi:uncharacterized membrane protein YkvA (DUF1232 family)